MVDYKQIIKDSENKFKDVIDFFISDIANIRTGRATPSLVEDLKVEIYGSMTTIKELATISIPEPKSIVIQPWDRKALQEIATAVENSDLGVNPVLDGEKIRINFPHLTEERRLEFIKLLKKKVEESRIKLRRERDELWNKIQAIHKKGEIRDDDKFNAKDELQKVINKFNKEIEDLSTKKEKDLMVS